MKIDKFNEGFFSKKDKISLKKIGDSKVIDDRIKKCEEYISLLKKTFFSDLKCFIKYEYFEEYDNLLLIINVSDKISNFSSDKLRLSNNYNNFKLFLTYIEDRCDFVIYPGSNSSTKISLTFHNNVEICLDDLYTKIDSKKFNI